MARSINGPGHENLVLTHIKGRLLDHTVILFNCFPLQNRNISLRERFLSLRKVPYDMENHFYYIR